MDLATAYEDDYVVDENGCWIWQRKRDRGGYGLLHRGGKDSPTQVAHRWWYEQVRGPIPQGLQLDHLCRVRACVNPAHLEPVTRRTNIRRGANTKLTAAQADEIRASSDGPAALARRYGMSVGAVEKIRNGQRWKADRKAGS